jgi:poly-beta-1,6-N-acetyl-D-glucosamine synthase
MRIAVIVVFLDEQEHLGTLLKSIAAQRRPPDRLLLVDDGSTDRSSTIAEDFASVHGYATLLRRPARTPGKDRLASASVWVTFAWAVEQLAEPFDVVAKLDADLQLHPALLADIEERFAADPELGLTGPYLSEPQADGSLRRLRGRPEHVNGATKFYRLACYRQVYPLPPLLNLDMVDELKARAYGWRTASFEATGGDPIHLRPMGTRDGVLRGFRRWGAGEYVSGSHPLLILFVGLQRLRDRPPGLGALNYFLGWVLAALRRTPRFPPELRELRRQEQLRRVRERLSGAARR